MLSEILLWVTLWNLRSTKFLSFFLCHLLKFMIRKILMFRYHISSDILLVIQHSPSNFWYVPISDMSDPISLNIWFNCDIASTRRSKLPEWNTSKISDIVQDLIDFITMINENPHPLYSIFSQYHNFSYVATISKPLIPKSSDIHSHSPVTVLRLFLFFRYNWLRFELF